MREDLIPIQSRTPYLFFCKRGGSIHILGLLRHFLWVSLRILWAVLIVLSNRPFPSSLVPLFQSESKCETILMKMT